MLEKSLITVINLWRVCKWIGKETDECRCDAIMSEQELGDRIEWKMASGVADAIYSTGNKEAKYRH